MITNSVDLCQAHYVINTSAVADFTSVHPSLGAADRLLDFGCGTGETTLAMAQVRPPWPWGGHPGHGTGQANNTLENVTKL